MGDSTERDGEAVQRPVSGEPIRMHHTVASSQTGTIVGLAPEGGQMYFMVREDRGGRVCKYHPSNVTLIESKPDPFDSQDFYELMQTYRFAAVHQLTGVVDAFEAVKTFARKVAKEQS